MINVVGLGYIGLPTSLMIASSGLEVVGTDISERVVNSISETIENSLENGIKDLYEKAVSNGLTFTLNPVQADVYIISVPTPVKEENGEFCIDTGMLEDALTGVLKVCPDGSTIVVESTVGPDTFGKVVFNMIEKSGKKIGIAYAPERVIPGNLIKELSENNRVIGVDNPETGKIVGKIYSSFVTGNIDYTDIVTACMIKLAENSFRAVNIAFANELAKICKADNVDVNTVINIANKHPRVNILNPGIGVGGHCLPVDPWFLTEGHEDESATIISALRSNDSMPECFVNLINDEMKKRGISDCSKVGIYGLTYKADTDDCRNSPARNLIHMEPNFKSFDPMITRKVEENQILDFNEFTEQIDLMVILVEHSHLKMCKSDLKVDVISYKDLLRP